MAQESCRLVQGSATALGEVSARSSRLKGLITCVGADGQRTVTALSTGPGRPMLFEWSRMAWQKEWYRRVFASVSLQETEAFCFA